MLVAILIAMLLFLGFGSLPWWPYSRSWGYYGAGCIGGILLLAGLLLLLHAI